MQDDIKKEKVNRREIAGQMRKTQNMYANLTRATAAELVDALVEPNTRALLVNSNLDGFEDQGAVFDVPLQGFPTEGNSFIVLSNGVAANTPGTAIILSDDGLGGVHLAAGDPLGNPSGDESNDTVTLTLTFSLPADPGILSFNWKFGSEELPGLPPMPIYTDYFRADVFTSMGTNNIALLPDSNPVTAPNMVPFANVPAGDSDNPQPPYPTPDDVVYNSMTRDINTAAFDLSPYAGQTISIAFRVGDGCPGGSGDESYNSAAFIDNLRISGAPPIVTLTRGVPF